MWTVSKLSLVVKLAVVAGLSMVLMADMMVFAILDLSAKRRGRPPNCRHARRFASSRRASRATAIRSVTDSRLAGTHGDDLGRHALRVFRRTLDRISDVTGARLTFFTYDAGHGASALLHQCPAGDGRPATGTTLNRRAGNAGASSGSAVFAVIRQVLGLTNS
jgi:hypothetical protein